MFNLFKSSAWELIKQLDKISKFILLALFITSIICLAIFILKYFFFKRELASVKKLKFKIRNIRDFNDFVVLRKEFEGTLGGYFLEENLMELRKILEAKMKSSESSSSVGEKNILKIGLTENELESFNSGLDLSLSYVNSESEKYLPILSTSFTAGPLVGLLGTVWGLIHVFINIGQEKSADITVVGPGIAEALIVTLAGLVVAIPAMIFFHYFVSKHRRLEQDFIDVAELFYSSVKSVFSK